MLNVLQQSVNEYKSPSSPDTSTAHLFTMFTVTLCCCTNINTNTTAVADTSTARTFIHHVHCHTLLLSIVNTNTTAAADTSTARTFIHHVHCHTLLLYQYQYQYYCCCWCCYYRIMWPLFVSDSSAAFKASLWYSHITTKQWLWVREQRLTLHSR